MLFIDDTGNIINELNDSAINFKTVPFDLKNKYEKNNPALMINFNDDNYNLECIKKLIKLENKKIIFNTNYKDKKIKYILNNYNDNLLSSIKAISISNLKEKYTYIYDNLFQSLNLVWEKNNPCKFCDNSCIASRNHKTAHEKNGCCYSFVYSKNIFKFIDDVKLCQYLGEDKKCTTQNISCKLFVCNYLRKNKIFQIKINDYFLIKAFFNNKQKLIIKYNFFKSKNEIINKLLEKNNQLFLPYYIKGNYRI